MSAFANLMALSASQTAEQQSAVETAIRDRQRREAERRKAQEAREAKEREQEKQRRLKMFEEQKKEEERKKREAELQKARELALKRNEDEARDKLLYGPKKAAKMAGGSHGSGSGGARGTNGGKGKASPDDGDDGPVPLTREELRERKLRMEMMRMYGGSKRSSGSHHGGTHRAGRRLPGGAVDITSPSHSAPQSSQEEGLSVRERFKAMPNTLVKLNTVKRDTRTIDEILQDRAKEKKRVLEGDQAAQFDDWFGSKKKDERSRPPSVGSGSGADTPQRPSTSAQKKVATVPPSKSIPPSKPSAPLKAPQNRGSTSKLPDFNKSKPFASASKPSAKHDYDRERSRDRDRERDRDKDKDRQHASSSKHRDTSTRKRPRSDSRSMSPAPYSSKKRHRSTVEDEDDMDISTEIWKLFGKNKSQYVQRDVLSDDEDMEADVRDVEMEEMKSYRLAQREDQIALEEERRREEEKKRKKKLLARP